jgi:hypothetical protein
MDGIQSLYKFSPMLILVTLDACLEHYQVHVHRILASRHFELMQKKGSFYLQMIKDHFIQKKHKEAYQVVKLPISPFLLTSTLLYPLHHGGLVVRHVPLSQNNDGEVRQDNLIFLLIPPNN